MNYIDKSYFGFVSEGSSFRKTMIESGMVYPDKFMNYEVDKISDIFEKNIKNNKMKFLEYFANKQFYNSCNVSINKILGDLNEK